MGFSAPIKLRSFLGLSAEALTAIVIGALGAVLIIVALEKGLAASVAIMGAIPILILVLIKPRIGSLLLIFSMCFIEEFPGGVSDQDAERSARTIFYELTLGISAVYIPDVMVLGLVALYYLHSIIYRTSIPVQLDKIGIALLMVLVVVMISLMISAGSAHPFGDPVLDLSLVGVVELPEKIARMIALLQFKLFLLINH